jgi:branched-chain amino acid transport system substrate-binding protein
MEDKTMKKETTIRYGLIILLIASLVGCANGEGHQGVTDDTIRVGMIADLTGPLAFVGQQARDGAQLHIDLINARGGVHGRKLELIVEDDGYQPARSVAAYRKLVDLDDVFCLIGNVGSPTTQAVIPIVEREKVPLLWPTALSSAIYTPPRRYVFASMISYHISSWIMAQYVRETRNGGDVRLGVIYQDDDFGLDGLAGLREAAAYYDLPIVAEESYKRGAVDFSTQVLNIKKADPTHVILWTVLRETAAVFKEADQLDWRPQFLVNNAAADNVLAKLAGKTAGNALVLTMLDTSREEEQTKQYVEFLDKYAKDSAPSQFHAFGYAMVQALVEALERAGKDLTREKLVEALETFNRWDENLLSTPISYNAGLRGGLAVRVFFSRADPESETLVRVTDDILFEMPQI